MSFGEKYTPLLKPLNPPSISKDILNSEEGQEIIKISQEKRKDLQNKIHYGPFTEKETKAVTESTYFIFKNTPNELEEKFIQIRLAKNFNKGLSQEEIKDIVNKISKKYIKKRNEKELNKQNIRKKINQENNISVKNNIPIKEGNLSNKVSNIFKKEGLYTLTTEYGTIEGITEKEYKTIGIKEKDGEIIIENPKILKNLINFYKFFKDLNLLGIWKYRKDIVKAIGDIDINLEDDSLKKSELILFGNKLIDFINNLKKNKDNGLKKSNSINTLKEELRGFSGANSPLSENKTFNIYGEGNFAANLRSFGIIGGAYFHIMKFRDILNGKNLQKR